MRYLHLVIYFFVACASPLKEYEYLEKDEAFRNTINSGNFIELSQGFTYYESNNLDNESLLVLIHGFSVPSYIWDETYYEAIDRNINVLRMDLYGRGFSDNPNVIYSDELYANQVIELLDRLSVKGKVVLVGLSNGGRVISKIADMKPSIVKKLIYVSPAGFHNTKTGPDTSSVTRGEIDSFIKERYSTISKGQMEDFKNSSQFKGWDKKYEDLLKYKGFARALISTTRNNYSLDKINQKIGISDIPQYAIWGDSDTVLPLKKVKEKIKKLMPSLELIVIKNSGHLPNKEQFHKFNEAFFDKILSKNKLIISASDAISKLENSDYLFLDVRTFKERQISSIYGSPIVPISSLQARINELEQYKDKKIIVYCRSGSRSQTGTNILNKNGFTAMNLVGGMIGWEGPTVKGQENE